MPAKRTRICRSRQEVATILKDFENSGHSRKEYARLHGIPLSTLVWWLKRRRRQAKQGRPAERRSRVIPVHVAGFFPDGATDCFDLTLRDGRRLRIPGRFNAASLKELLGVLES